MKLKFICFWIPCFSGLFLCLAGLVCEAQTGSDVVGQFDSQTDVGVVSPPGSGSYDDGTAAYRVAGSGANMWSTGDAFHFVWKKVSGDVSLTADMTFPSATGNPNPHRKAVLMFRQTLDADAVYADAAQHGSGMTALQYRREKGATTQDIELNIASPREVKLEKRGDTITMFLSNHGEPLHQAGASIKLHLEGTFYAGLGVCSHEDGIVENATFAHVKLEATAPTTNLGQPAIYSTLQTIGIEPNFRRAIVIATGQGRMEAPNWSRDGKTLIFNRDGKIWTIPAEGGSATVLSTGNTTKCTGSHGLSPDGKWLAISCSMPDKPETRVYIVPANGGEPRLHRPRIRPPTFIVGRPMERPSPSRAPTTVVEVTSSRLQLRVERRRR